MCDGEAGEAGDRSTVRSLQFRTKYVQLGPFVSKEPTQVLKLSLLSDELV